MGSEQHNQKTTTTQNSLRKGNSNGALAGDEDVQIVDLVEQIPYNTRTTSHCAGRNSWDISFLAIT
jgi:hypothetical protein